jgi:hypothetical protein
MSSDDRVDSSTRVLVAKRAWAPVVMSCLTLNGPVA